MPPKARDFSAKVTAVYSTICTDDRVHFIYATLSHYDFASKTLTCLRFIVCSLAAVGGSQIWLFYGVRLYAKAAMAFTFFIDKKVNKKSRKNKAATAHSQTLARYSFLPTRLEKRD